MTKNKNQHYVPKCYFRPFTVGLNEKSLNVFNVNRKIFIKGAPVKGQCAGDYFYGRDARLEAAIQFVESGYGTACKEIIDKSNSLSAGTKSVFKIFWLLQYLRTEAAARQIVAMNESTRVLADIPPEEFSLGIKEAVQLAMM